MIPPSFSPHAFKGRFGVARRDITPPEGIYSRNWGAATHDIAQSVHRPLTLTALIIREDEGQGEQFALITMDLSWWRSGEEEEILMNAALDCGFQPGHVAIALAHNHASPSFCPGLSDKPGGHLIRPYLDYLAAQLQSALEEAAGALCPGILETATGHCGLAAHRDLPDPESDRFLVGWNPGGEADQTLLVGRISDSSGQCLATLVNYACHPTILAWENTAISPDFVGTMRELVEAETGSPMLFLQGASGELAPRHQYVADPAIADQAGRCLGHAVLSVLALMLKPGCRLAFKGMVESGAPLAVWRPEERESIPSGIAVREVSLDFPLVSTLRPLAELDKDLEGCADPVLRERLLRKRAIRKAVGEGSTYRVNHPIWKFGDILFVMVPNEIYSDFQVSLRNAAKSRSVFVSTLTNGSRGYLSPRELYDKNLYPVWQSPFAEGCFELLLDRVTKEICDLPPV